jgi:hypothetical protein
MPKATFRVAYLELMTLTNIHIFVPLHLLELLLFSFTMLRNKIHSDATVQEHTLSYSQNRLLYIRLKNYLFSIYGHNRFHSRLVLK